MRYLRSWKRRRAPLNTDDPNALKMALQQRELELQEARRAIHILEHRLADREAEIEALRRISEAAGSALASESML
ncbi:MAG: hypothetical protein NZM10_02395, partial [Fimbriimonadales bacterium]|nr:hypothetical protein [Fimbriimonadales bacterium]